MSLPAWAKHQIATSVGSHLGKALTISDHEQLAVLLDAFVIYKERNDRYQDLWKEYGAADTAHHLKSKALRVGAELGRTHEPGEAYDLDDAFDAVNYAAFTIRNVREGRLG